MSAMQDADVVCLRGVTVRRGDTHLLKGVDWTVKPGEQWAVLGANGSGKTSLLNTLSGFLQPTSGTIEVFGQRFGQTNWNELRKVIGVINHTVADWIQEGETALEIVIGGIHSQINYWGRITKADVARARETLAGFGLAAAENRTWSQLSQGERQRILIARAIMASYRILILDEPCAGLDPVARHRFLEFMDGIASRPEAPALFLVTHHVEEITPGFDHVLLLRQGEVLASGRRGDVLDTASLSRAYDAPVRLRQSAGRLFLEVE
jgi:iron complex transport system ATP-binding protein